MVNRVIFRRLAHMHATRLRVSSRKVGYGHLYQGRLKSFPVNELGFELNIRPEDRPRKASQILTERSSWQHALRIPRATPNNRSQKQ